MTIPTNIRISDDERGLIEALCEEMDTLGIGITPTNLIHRALSDGLHERAKKLGELRKPSKLPMMALLRSASARKGKQ